MSGDASDKIAMPIRRLGVREGLCLGSRFGFGGVCADVCDPVANERQEPLEAVDGHLAERDFRPQAGQVRFTVEPAPHRSRTLSLPSHPSNTDFNESLAPRSDAAGRSRTSTRL